MSMIQHSSEPEHTISVVGIYQGHEVHSVDPIVDPEEERRKALGTQESYLQSRRAEMAFDESLRRARMHTLPRGVTADIGDYDIHTIGGSSR